MLWVRGQGQHKKQSVSNTWSYLHEDIRFSKTTLSGAAPVGTNSSRLYNEVYKAFDEGKKHSDRLTADTKELSDMSHTQTRG